MLTRDQRTLLDNFLDALDRLFDGESGPSDVHALLIATVIGLEDGRLREPFDKIAAELRSIVASSDVQPQRKRELALYLTDDLRHFVAGELDRDERRDRSRSIQTPDSSSLRSSE